jgi:hypothetical protein
VMTQKTLKDRLLNNEFSVCCINLNFTGHKY